MGRLREGVFLGLLTVAIIGAVISHTEDRSLLHRLNQDEAVTHAQEMHTAKVQKAGEPTGVCLREAMRAGLPVVVNFEHALQKGLPHTPRAQRPVVELFIHLTQRVQAPLAAYVNLQSHRYAGIECPDSFMP